MLRVTRPSTVAKRRENFLSTNHSTTLVEMSRILYNPIEPFIEPTLILSAIAVAVALFF